MELQYNIIYTIGNYPDEVFSYIAYGQVVGMLRGEKIGYEILKELVKNANSSKDYKKLEKLGDYPIYYMLGENDRQVPSTLAAEYHNKIEAPEKKFYWIKNARHFTEIDNPQGFCEVLCDIVKEIAHL